MHMLHHGRRRRYFGYPGKLEGLVDTPDAARSFASIPSPVPGRTKAHAKTGKCFKPDKPLPKRFADKILHQAIAAQIPALLPPMKNTYRFRDYEENPMRFHPPQLEHHFERSLYYIWLSKNDRSELCNIVDAHLGGRDKHGVYRGARAGGNRYVPIVSPADYSLMPRTNSRVEDPPPIPRNLKARFQKGIWDPPKTPRERFVRDHGRSPAMEAICHMYPAGEKTRVTEKDIQECIIAAKLLLGPYAGINTAFTTSEDIPPEILEMIEEEDRIERLKSKEKKEIGVSQRPFGYNSSQLKYERKILAAMEYYNQLKTGQNAPPPTEITGRNASKPSQRHDSKADSIFTVKKSQAEMASIAQLNDVDEGATATTSRHRHHKRKFNKDNVTEEDYMNMYVHFVGSSEDVRIKTKPPPSLTDISKMRRKMNVDPNPENAAEEEELRDLLKNDSFSDVPDATARKILKGNYDPFRKSQLEQEDLDLVKTLMVHQASKIPSPKMKDKMRTMAPIATRRSIVPPPIVSNASSDFSLDGDEEQQAKYNEFERKNGYVEKDAEEFVEETEREIAGTHDADSSDDMSSEAIGSPEVDGRCSWMDLMCLSDIGVLGLRPFTSSQTRANNPRYHKDDRPSDKDEKPETSIFAKEHWVKEGENNNLS